MYRFTAEGTVVKILDPKVCSSTGYVKRCIIIQDAEGDRIAPEFNPAKFNLISSLKEGDQVKVEFRPKVNNSHSAHFLKVQTLEVI